MTRMFAAVALLRNSLPISGCGALACRAELFCCSGAGGRAGPLIRTELSCTCPTYHQKTRISGTHKLGSLQTGLIQQIGLDFLKKVGSFFAGCFGVIDSNLGGFLASLRDVLARI